VIDDLLDLDLERGIKESRADKGNHIGEIIPIVGNRCLIQYGRKHCGVCSNTIKNIFTIG
jgi:hypothetical protein